MSNPTKTAPWEDFVLRLIGIYKFLHGLLFVGIGFGLIKLKHHDIPQFLMTYVIEPLQISPENKFVDWILDSASKLTDHRLVMISDYVFFYAVLFCIEGVGLYLRKHWAEYFVVIVTGSLLPFEIYIIAMKVEWWKCGAIVVNLLILAYLIHRLRLDFTNASAPRGSDDPGDGTGTSSLREDQTGTDHVTPGRR
jgi:uncharacterized membrane protein (DUF2068 family)